MQNHFNQTIEILRRTNTGTDFQPVWVWNTVNAVGGLIAKLSEREIVKTEGNVIIADYKIYLSYQDLKHEDQLKCGEEYFTIYSIDNPNRMNRHLEIKAKIKAYNE